MLMVINGLMVKNEKKLCLFLFFYVDPNLRFLIRNIYSLYVNIACIFFIVDQRHCWSSHWVFNMLVNVCAGEHSRPRWRCVWTSVICWLTFIYTLYTLHFFNFYTKYQTVFHSHSPKGCQISVDPHIPRSPFPLCTDTACGLLTGARTCRRAIVPPPLTTAARWPARLGWDPRYTVEYAELASGTHGHPASAPCVHLGRMGRCALHRPPRGRAWAGALLGRRYKTGAPGSLKVLRKKQPLGACHIRKKVQREPI